MKFVRRTVLIIFILVAAFLIRKWQSDSAAARRLETARVRLREGSALAGAGKMEQALAKWKEAAELDPQAVEPYVLRGNFFWSQRQFRRAADEFMAAHRLKPADVTILFALIQNLIDAGNQSQVELLARRAVRLAPDNPKAHAYLGIFLAHVAHREDALAEAERELHTAHDMAPGMPIPLIELGKLHYRQGRLKEAKSTLKQAWNLLHQGARTAQYLESAAEVENRRAETAYTLGLVCRSLRESREMEEWFAHFRRFNARTIKRGDLQLRLSRNPNDVEALLDLAEMNLQAESYREAADFLQRALRLQPDNQRGRALAQRLMALSRNGGQK